MENIKGLKVLIANKSQVSENQFDYDFLVHFDKMKVEFSITNEVTNKVCYDICLDDEVYGISINTSEFGYSLSGLLYRIENIYKDNDVFEFETFSKLCKVIHYLERNKDIIEEE